VGFQFVAPKGVVKVRYQLGAVDTTHTIPSNDPTFCCGRVWVYFD